MSGIYSTHRGCLVNVVPVLVFTFQLMVMRLIQAFLPSQEIQRHISSITSPP